MGAAKFVLEMNIDEVVTLDNVIMKEVHVLDEKIRDAVERHGSADAAEEKCVNFLFWKFENKRLLTIHRELERQATDGSALRQGE